MRYLRLINRGIIDLFPCLAFRCANLMPGVRRVSPLYLSAVSVGNWRIKYKKKSEANNTMFVNDARNIQIHTP